MLQFIHKQLTSLKEQFDLILVKTSDKRKKGIASFTGGDIRS